MKKDAGWAISEFRLPICGKDGSSTTLFHSIFRPGSTHARHLHSKCDEIAVYVSGRGTVGQRDERTEVRTMMQNVFVVAVNKVDLPDINDESMIQARDSLRARRRSTLSSDVPIRINN